jgi:hypothetical protein
MRKESQKSLCLSEMVLGERARCAPSSVGVVGDRYVRIWSIHDMGVVAAQLVRIASSAWVVVRVRIGLSHPVWLAQCCGAGWAPSLSVLVQLELRSPMSIAWWWGCVDVSAFRA